MFESPVARCSICKIVFADNENIEAIDSLGTCLLCDHLQADLYQFLTHDPETGIYE